MKLNRFHLLLLFVIMLPVTGSTSELGISSLRATGDLGLIIERAIGRVALIETSTNTKLAEIEGLGDLSHASVVYSRDERYAYVFGRDGGLTRLDMLSGKIDKRIMQSGNSIGGAISQDGSLVAVSNYEPGGVKVFDAHTLALIADIPAFYDEHGSQSKVVGLVDAPGQRFVFSLYEGNQVWVLDMSDPANPVVTKYRDVGLAPYDGLITPDGRYYIAGLYGEDGLALLDLWYPEKGIRHILSDYGRGQEKMPAGDYAFIPAVGRYEVLVVDTSTWQQVGRIPVHGQPVFVMGRPDGRQVWVNFAFPRNDTLQIIDVASMKLQHTLKPGKAVLHMEFTPRGEHVWVSVRDEDIVKIYDTASLEQIAEIPVDKPSGIFFTARAHRIGL